MLIGMDAEQRRLDYERARARRRAGAPGPQGSPLRVHAQIRAGIQKGLLEDWARLDEKRLIEEYSASRNSIRTALSLLADEGVVTRRPGAGTVVRGSIEGIGLHTGLVPGQDDQVGAIVETLASETVPATPFIRSQLGAVLVRVVTELASREGRPYAYYIDYTASESPRRPRTYDQPDEVYSELFRRTYGVPPGQVACTVQAVACDQPTAKLLDVATGSTLLLRERRLFDAAGVARELSYCYYVASRVALTTVVDLTEA